MARQLASRVKHDTGNKITTKTPYGTTSDMVVTDENILSLVELREDLVLVKDDNGYYMTQKNRVDSGLADPNRHSSSIRHMVNQEVNKALSNSNQPE